MKLEITPVVSHLRVFLDDSKGVDNKDPYDTIMTVLHLNDKEVYISGLKGVMSKETRSKISELLSSLGVTKVTYERNKVQVTEYLPKK